VVYESILENRKSTSAYWERRMVDAMEDDGGWESVANVEFQSHLEVQDSPGNVSPGLDFIPPPPLQFDNSLSDECESVEPTINSVDNNSLKEPTFLIDPPSPMEVPSPQPDQDILIDTSITKQESKAPAKQYVYGIGEQSLERGSPRIVETMIKKSASQENIIEAEIRAQQNKEEQLRNEGTLKHVRDHESSSPASHESDEGFVDRVAPEDASNHFTNSNNLITTNGYTHSIAGTNGEPVIYDAVPPPNYNLPGSLISTSKSTETKIALEIRELKEREEELRMIRERLTDSRQGFIEEDDTQSNSSRDQLLDDHLTSLTATTDEGNYSECGDPVLSEDKSSTGSNSGMSTPDIMSRGNLLDGSRRRVMTVMPFQEDTAEDEQPVYHRSQKESVIEREIRLNREREEAHRAENGLISSSTANRSPSVRSTVSSPLEPINDARDLTHRMATSRIQLEIQETSDKERELRDAGTILTTSEETVDSKVTRLSDLAELNWGNESPRRTPSQSSSGGRRGSTTFSPPSTPVPNFTPSPVAPMSRLKKSLSTTNLTTSPVSNSNVRAPKGLMQKFIASRGKMTASAFNPPSTNGNIPTDRGIATRPMRVEPKVAVIRREQNNRINNQDNTKEQKTIYRRSYCTAGEKIQSELKDMQMREEELRRLRASSMAASQPNLADLCLDDGPSENGIERETNGLQSAISNPNLLDDESSQPQVIEKGVRRRSALIAQWENRIQQTIDT